MNNHTQLYSQCVVVVLYACAHNYLWLACASFAILASFIICMNTSNSTTASMIWMNMLSSPSGSAMLRSFRIL